MSTISNNEILRRVERLEVGIENIKEEIDGLEGYKKTSIELKTQYANLERMLLEIRADVKNLQAKPANYWDSIIIVLITSTITYFLTKILGG